MEYYFSTVLNTNFKDAEAKITEALKVEGFGIISEIAFILLVRKTGVIWIGLGGVVLSMFL